MNEYFLRMLAEDYRRRVEQSTRDRVLRGRRSRPKHRSGRRHRGED